MGMLHGRFFGFRLHLIINDKGEILTVYSLSLKVKNNMRSSLMSIADKILLRKRALIETVNDELKNHCPDRTLQTLFF